MIQYDAIYARQSVDRMDSISIESQIEYCQYEARGGDYRVFQDKGYSGKNTDRPNFQLMLDAIRRGEVKRVIVYKLDRISRSILDFTAMMDEFQKHEVQFVSCTEKFDTATPMGRAMLNICIVFAQLERETIQQRVSDAYASRSRKGFYMGGRIPYGYRLEAYMIDGKKTSRYVIVPAEAEVVAKIYSLYAQPQTSIGDIVRYLTEHEIPTSGAGTTWDRARVSDMVKNPIYVRADLTVYRFFKEQGCVLHDAPARYNGRNGCYLYSDKEAKRKTLCLEGHHIVLAPHEGMVPADLWLAARRKCMNNRQVTKPLKAKNTWLAGKIKCGKCGYALVIRKSNSKTGRYFLCSHHLQSHSCEGVGGIDAAAFENFIKGELQKRVNTLEILAPSTDHSNDSVMHEWDAKAVHIELEIEMLLDRVSDADAILMGYINKRVAQLHKQADELRNRITDRKAFGHQSVRESIRIQNCMRLWDKLEFDDKRAVLDLLVFQIRATGDACEIIWRF